MDILRRSLALVLVLERHISPRPFLAIKRDTNGSCVSNGVELEEHGFKFCGCDLEGVHFDEFLGKCQWDVQLRNVSREKWFTFFLSTIQNHPFFTTATSPDLSHPSGDMDSLVAVGLRQ